LSDIYSPLITACNIEINLQNKIVDKPEKAEADSKSVLNIYIRQSTIRTNEVMYGGIDHRPCFSKKVRGFVFCADNFLTGHQ